MLTEAHYDHARKEFVIHSPSKEAMKFWIGGAGKTASMTVVWAQLIIDGKTHGVHAFVVPIRDQKTYKPLPGVLIGDCGHKSGLNGIDNGFLMFDQVRIPKDNLLDRISGVDENGKFRTTVENEEKRFGLHLGALSGGRFFIATNCAALALQALTIAIRYANERRQFKGKQDRHEKRLIEYPLMKRRLMPLLAANLVMYRGSMYYIAQNDNNLENFMDVKNPQLEHLHAISSMLKAKVSWFANECIQECRQAMGGHGYSSYAKIGSLYNDNDINLTWEGDNHVLIQQTSKYVLEQAQRVLQKGKQSSNPLLQFLSDVCIS
jgi:acyl-CoA oxidase